MIGTFKSNENDNHGTVNVKLVFDNTVADVLVVYRGDYMRNSMQHFTLKLIDNTFTGTSKSTHNGYGVKMTDYGTELDCVITNKQDTVWTGTYESLYPKDKGTFVIEKKHEESTHYTCVLV